MQDPEHKSFDFIPLEQDMRLLAREVQEHKNNPENRDMTDHEIVRKALETVTALPPPPAPAAPVSSQGPSGILPDYAKDATAENKLEIEYLVELAATRGILEASKIAQETSPFVLDAFHDALTGKLYDELVKSGVLK
jgi:hypothetical protein